MATSSTMNPARTTAAAAIAAAAHRRGLDDDALIDDRIDALIDAVGVWQDDGQSQGQSQSQSEEPEAGWAERRFPVPGEAAFRDPAWEPPEHLLAHEIDDAWPLLDFLPAPELERVARHLVAEHVVFHHLRPSNVVWSWLWKRAGGRRQGRAVLGGATKPTGLVRHFSGQQFVFWLAADHCRGFTGRQIEAAVWHELSHTALNEDGAFCLIGHDFEGFVTEVKRYGAWHRAQEPMAAAFQQLALPLPLPLEPERGG